MSQSHTYTSTTTNVNNSSSSSSHGNNSILPTYIVNTITNEIIEIKFSDEASRNQWLTLVHTHITPFIEENTSKEEASSTHLEAFSAGGGGAVPSTGSSLQYQHSCSSNGSFSSVSQLVHKNFKLTSSTGPMGSVPLLTANAYRCNSNISNSSSASSSGQGSYVSSNAWVFEYFLILKTLKIFVIKSNKFNLSLVFGN